MEVVLGALPSLLPKLDELLAGEYKLRKEVKGGIRFLQAELESIKAALEDISKTPADQIPSGDKIWARNVRELSYDIEDNIDTFMMQVKSGEPAKKHGFIKYINKPLGSSMQPKIHREIAIAIRDIKSRLVEVYHRHSRYEIRRSADKPVIVDPRAFVRYVNVTKLVGIDEARYEVIKILKEGTEVPMKQDKIVSIVGFAGLGKTTLANVLFENLGAQFDCSAFVSVSQRPDMERLFRDLFCQLANHNIASSSDLIDTLRKFLGGKRYFIVIDDLWDTSTWAYISAAVVTSNNNGSRIIVTTRNLQVATEVGEVYRMKRLSDIDSKKLLYARIFGGEDNCPNDDGLAKVSDRIIKKCGGLPLAIIEIASVLVFKPLMDWFDVYNSMWFGPGFESMTGILSLSYYDLPFHLRGCLLYLSVYPADHVLKKNKLIWSWIAEGFVHEKQTGIGLFEVGESYFHELITRNMIQPVMIEGTDIVYGCRVHDMVHDLIYYLSHEENFVSVLDEQGQIFSPSTKIRRLAIQNRKKEHILGDNMDLLPQLRSLTATGCPSYMVPPVSSFNFLRVLDLESCGSMEGYDLEHLGKLLHLRFIGLGSTYVRKLPDEMGNLKFLETLNLEGSGVEELPVSMGELTGLMCLNADWMTRVPNWIEKLMSLQQLVMYPGGGSNDEYSTRQFAKGLGNLRELRELRFLIKAQDEGQLRDLLESVLNLSNIKVLHFDYYGAQLNGSVMLELAGFAHYQNLCLLELRWMEFSRLPAWINARDLPNLCHLWLMLFDVDKQELEILGEFPRLRHLDMLIMNTERGGIVTSTSGAFQRLEFCSITKPLKFVPGAMPRLEVLDFHFSVRHLCDVKHDFDFGFGLGNIPSLRQVNVQINSLAAFPEEVEEAEAALRNSIRCHPNCPALEINLFGQQLKTFDADQLTRKLEKTDDDGANKISNFDKEKGVEVAKRRGKSAFYSRTLVHDVIDDPGDELIKMLSVVDNGAYNKKMKIVPIVRSEGLGNTSLAQKVFDKLSPQFDCGAFVVVGQNPDLRKVFTDILIGLDKQKYKDFPLTILDLMELIWLVRKSLINKRFFVVVDDIWDLNTWDIIQCALIENSNGCIILTTTRPQNWKCLKWKTYDNKSHFDGSKQSPTNSTTDPKKLFYKSLFGSEDKCPPELKDICTKLIATCGGILSVIVETVELLGSVPRTLKDWQVVYDRRNLALSYPDLPDNLKKCLLYFSMFKKGHEISGERIVWAWIAEGFLQKTQEQTLQEVGESYLSKLVMRKMIEAVEVDASGKALSCCAYDWVHDFIISKSAEANFVAILNESQGSASQDTVQRLSIQGNYELPSRPKAWLSQVQSLVVSCDSMPSVSEFPGLHVMDLGGCDSLQHDHLKGINKTTSLGYLVIGGKYIAGIPTEITKLKHLHTLDLSASGLNELPQCVFSLTKLERLCVHSSMKIPDDGIARMSALQELGDVNITKPELLKNIYQLSKLRVLRIAIWSWDESLNTYFEQLCDNLRTLVRFMENIQSLSILTCCSLDFMDDLGEKWTPQSLRKLEIRYSAFNRLPSWFGLLSNVSSLTIEVYELSEGIMDVLGKLPTLGSLSLTSKQVPKVYFVVESDRFNNLASLKFVSNAMAKMFAPSQPNATQRLNRLTIVFQASRTEDINKDFSFGLENLSSLEHVRAEIICLNATHKMVNNAEAAIREAISRDCNSHPNLEIRRLREESMIEEDLCDSEKRNLAQTFSLKDQGNGEEPDSKDLLMASHFNKTKGYNDVAQAAVDAIETARDEILEKGGEPRSGDEITGVVLSKCSQSKFLANSGIHSVSSNQPSTNITSAPIRELEEIVQEQTLQIQNTSTNEQELRATISSHQQEIMELKRQIEEANRRNEDHMSIFKQKQEIIESLFLRLVSKSSTV